MILIDDSAQVEVTAFGAMDQLVALAKTLDDDLSVSPTDYTTEDSVQGLLTLLAAHPLTMLLSFESSDYTANFSDAARGQVHFSR